MSSLEEEVKVESLGVAEMFYGDMYGNEGYISDQNVAIRKADGELWIATYEKDETGLLVPNYRLKASERDRAAYLVPLKNHVEIFEPSILITYGQEFLAALGAVEDFRPLWDKLQVKDDVAKDHYAGFKGYIGTYKEYEELKRTVTTKAEAKLYEFLELGQLSKFPQYFPYYKLWKSSASNYFSETKAMALDTTMKILEEPERKERYLKFTEIHCEHNEDADLEEVLRLIRLYLKESD